MCALLASVVIPVGRAGPDLDRQLAAVADQAPGFAFEIVVSWNSPDERARKALPGVIRGVPVRAVDSSDRRGAAHARNAGAAASAAEMLAFCDADDVVQPGWLAALAAGLDEYDAVTGHVNEIAPPRQASWRPPATPGRLPEFLGVPYILSGNLAIKRAVFDAVGGFDESLTRCEDIALGWKLQHGGYRIGFAPDAVLDYWHRAGLRAMLHQHYLYGRGMAEVLARYPRPGGGGRRDLLRANRQPASRSYITVLRRAAIAAGRLRGLISR